MYAFFFFNDTATTEIYTLSLHDALPISTVTPADVAAAAVKAIEKDKAEVVVARGLAKGADVFYALSPDVTMKAAKLIDRKSTRLNSSHANISYAVFCLKKTKNPNNAYHR